MAFPERIFSNLYTAHPHNRLVCCHDIDHVINDEDRTITVVLAKHKNGSLMMVPA
jgi:hypothetical protein